MADLRSQIAAARGHLETAVENTLFDLGRVGHAAARDILTEINDDEFCRDCGQIGCTSNVYE